MRKSWRFILLALLACQATAFAQSSTAAKPTPSTSTSISTSTSTTATKKINTGEIYRWVDSKGKVQYSADVPEDRRSTARKVDTRSNIVSSRVPASIGGAPAPSNDATAPSVRKPVTEREKCEAAWQQYNEAQVCFANYRQGTVAGTGKKAGSAVSPEALEKCQNVSEPAACR